MDRDFNHIREDVLSLAVEERAQLRDDLTESLIEVDPYFEAQLDEAERRWKSIESGKAKLFSIEQVVAEARNSGRK